MTVTAPTLLQQLLLAAVAAALYPATTCLLIPSSALMFRTGTVDDVVDTASAGPKPWGKLRPFPSLVVAVEGLCSVSGKDDKNTIRVDFDLGDSGLAYLPGDALGIYPTNGSEVLAGWGGVGGSGTADWQGQRQAAVRSKNSGQA